LLAEPQIKSMDALDGQEIGSLVALVELIDADLLNRGLTNRSGDASALITLRAKARRPRQSPQPLVDDHANRTASTR
jgi:hypothetical protein